MTKPNEREAFEAWAKASTSHNLVTIRDGRYMDPETACAWRAWQAALTREQREGVDVERQQNESLGMYARKHVKSMGYATVADALDDLERRIKPQQEAPGAVAWMMELAKEIKANAEDHPSDYISRFALQWADTLAARAISATPPAPVDVRVLLQEARDQIYRLAGGFTISDQLIARIDRALLDGQPAGVEHVASKDCWCEPTQDTEEPSVYIHRSKDDGH